MSKKLFLFCALILVLAAVLSGCASASAELDTNRLTNDQNTHYNRVQPLHFYDYSIPKDVLQQIYDITTAKAVATYSVAETITGVTKYQCPSIGYAIPADTQLTNPVRPLYPDYRDSTTVEQSEPNGLFSSNNTDGTWVLCVGDDGTAYPYYSEHKVQTWPFPVYQDEAGEWHRVEGSATNVAIDTTKIRQEIEIKLLSPETP